MNKFICPLGNQDNICRQNCVKKNIKTRSGVKKKLYSCLKCDFQFFNEDPKKKLIDNKLDISRLYKVGIPIPLISEEYRDGLKQSEDYVKKYIKKNDADHKILEIGCGLGYFLDLIKKKCDAFGLEINIFKKNYVNNKVKIRCESDLSKYKNIRFKKIFMFYSFEYIYNPYKYLIELKSFLTKNGSIIIVTPNKNDVLKNILGSKSYKKFFYEENSINYFSKKSMEVLVKNISFKKHSIFTNQGYSIVNFINWFLNHSPKKTGYVGEDKYMQFLEENLRTFDKNNNNKELQVKRKLCELFINCNKEFCQILEDFNLGNQVILELKNS
jgi:SAM-dependent methyltransferase